MRRILFSILTIGVLGAGAVFGFSRAFFSDTETSADNRFDAGALDLLIDNTSYYNGVFQQDTSWQLDDLPGHLFFNFFDLKPSDEGEDTISIHVNDNPAWACMEIDLTKNDDNGSTDLELADGDTSDDADNDFDGELAQNVNIIFWADDGDNVLEASEAATPTLTQGPLATVFDDTTITLADSLENNMGGVDGEPLAGAATYFIGKAWCFGTLTTNPVTDGQGVDPTVDPGILCDGSNLDNTTQTDQLMADISFSVVQHRNNPDFTCQPIASPSPSPPACEQAEVMLVLDRSGGTNSTELAQLKTAAKDFVDSMGLTLSGIHAGKSSFATFGNLNHHLTSDPTSLKAAIDAMTTGGFTNLKEGIDLAKTEMDFPGDGHDRVDLTSPDKMVVITEGHPNRPVPSSTADDAAANSADTARAAGIEIFVVGVGNDVDTTYLQNEIADDADHYYSVTDYSGLQTILQNLDLCGG